MHLVLVENIFISDFGLRRDRLIDPEDQRPIIQEYDETNDETGYEESSTLPGTKATVPDENTTDLEGNVEVPEENAKVSGYRTIPKRKLTAAESNVAGSEENATVPENPATCPNVPNNMRKVMPKTSAEVPEETMIALSELPFAASRRTSENALDVNGN